MRCNTAKGARVVRLVPGNHRGVVRLNISRLCKDFVPFLVALLSKSRYWWF
jgi:hypothetical protein